METKTQLYKIRMLCALCGHRFDRITDSVDYHLCQCPQCKSYSAQKIWDTKAEPR